jgi:hypothetical protein
MNGKEYYDKMRELVHKEKMMPDAALMRILGAMWNETSLLAKENAVVLEADFVDLIAHQNEKYKHFARCMNIDADGFILFIITRNSELWMLLKDHHRFQDIAKRCLARIGPMLRKVEEQAAKEKSDNALKDAIDEIVKGDRNGD